MESFTERLRADSEESKQLARALLEKSPLIKRVIGPEGDEVSLDATNLVSAIVNLVNAATYKTAADAIDYIRLSNGQDFTFERRRKLIQRNEDIRRAAAEGNWDEFDQLVAGFGDGQTDSPGSTPGGAAAH